jgi:hypothetical protein
VLDLALGVEIGVEVGRGHGRDWGQRSCTLASLNRNVHGVRERERERERRSGKADLRLVQGRAKNDK